MKTLKTSVISSTARAPITDRTLSHLIESHKETVEALLKGLVTDTTGIIILYGCVPTVAGSDYSLTAGAVYYNGEIYLVDAFATATAPGGQIPVWVLATTYRSGDPVEFKNSSGASAGFLDFHEIRKLKWQFGASGSGLFDYNSASVKTKPSLTSLQADLDAAVIAGYTVGALSLVGGASDGSGTDFYPPQLITDNNLINRLRGVLNVTLVGGTPKVVSSISVGSRPLKNLTYWMPWVSSGAYIGVMANGDIIAFSLASAAYSFDLENCGSWRGEQ
jgi:hypothetical protein